MRFALLGSMLVVSVIASLPGCGGDGPSAPVGVNDVRKACEIRQSWKLATSDKCISCQSAAPLADCGCEAFKEYAAKCLQPEEALKSEPSCTDQVEICVKTCVLTDCDCIDKCYVQAEACRRVAGGRDGCVAEVCAPYCN